MRNPAGLVGILPSRPEFTSAAVASLIVTGSSKFALLGASILLARWLGPSEFGIYAYAMAVAMLLNVPAQLGFPTLLIRLIPTYQAKHQWGLLRGLLRNSVSTVGCAALTVSLLGTLLVLVFRNSLPEGYSGIFLWAMALLPAIALLSLSSAMLRGMHRVGAGQITELLLVPLLFLSLIVATQMLGAYAPARLTSETAMAARSAATAIALFVASWLVVRTLPDELTGITSYRDRASWMRAALPLTIFGGLSILNTQTDVLMLASMQNAEAAGIYQASARGAELVAFSLFILNPVIQPRMARLHALGHSTELQCLVTATARIALVASLPVALTLAIFSAPVLRIVYGPEFEAGALSLSLLCVAQLVNVAAGLVGQVLIMTGYERDAAAGLAVGATVNVTLNALLIPVWSITGAAIATGTSLIVWNIFLMNRVRARTGLHSSILRMPPRT